jgi:hypothetical protein
MERSKELEYNDPVKNAYHHFCREGFEYGQVVNKEWFMDKFGLPEPQTIREANDVSMLYAQYMGTLRKLLLTENKVALRTKHGVGQEVVKPSEQTDWAMREVKSRIALEIEKAYDRIMYINRESLSEDEHKENRDALAKLSFFNRKSLKRLSW